MNKVILIGRLAADPEASTTPSGVNVCRFRLAVSRNFKTADGVEADFFNVTAWRQLGVTCTTYLKKGSQCCVVGSLQNRSYEKDGQTRYVTDVIADSVEFLGSRNSDSPASSQGGSQGSRAVDQLEPADDGDDSLPF